MPVHATSAGSAIDRAALLDRFRRVRARSRQLFDLITPDAYFSRPITLRNPVVFYEGHLAAFSVNTLLKKALGRTGHRPGARSALRARHRSRARAARRVAAGVVAVARSGDRVRRAIRSPARGGAELGASSIGPGIRCSTGRRPCSRSSNTRRCTRRRCSTSGIACPSTRSTGRQPDAAHERHRTAAREGARSRRERPRLGARRDAVPFGWDNEFGELPVHVPAFAVDRHNVTNAEFLAFVEAGGYERESLWAPAAWAWRTSEGVTHPLFWERQDGQWYWRGMFDLVPLPDAWPVYVSHAEADAFARWRGERLMTEAEYHRAAFGTPEGERTCTAVGRRPARSDARQLRRPALGSRAGGIVPRRRERVRRARSDRQRLGVDVVAVRAIPRLFADGVVSRVLRRFLRRRPLRAQGGIAGDARRARAPQLPQLVPTPLSLCLRHVPLRALTPSPLAAFAEDVRAGLLARPKRLPALWFYDALGSALFEAICRLPWYRITRSESALLGTPRGVDRGRRGIRGIVHRAGWRERREARRPDCRRPFGAGSARTVHLVDVSAASARSGGGHAVTLRRRARHDT